MPEKRKKRNGSPTGIETLYYKTTLLVQFFLRKREGQCLLSFPFITAAVQAAAHLSWMIRAQSGGSLGNTALCL